MRRDEILKIIFIVLLFGSMSYAILSSIAEAANTSSPATPSVWTGPAIPKCDLPLWERIRYMCPKETKDDDQT